MNEEKIALLRARAEELRKQLAEMDEAEAEAIKAKLNALTNRELYVRTNGFPWGFEVALPNPKTGYGQFATEVEVRYRNRDFRGDDYHIEFDTGSSGSFDKGDEGQIFKYKTMAALLDHADEFEAMAKAYHAKVDPIEKELWDTAGEASDLERQNQQRERDAKRAEVLANVKTGAWFVSEDGKSAYLVIKKTAKMVFFKYYALSTGWYGDKKPFWRNEDGWRNETLTHNEFTSKIVLNDYRLAERPEGVNPSDD